MLGAIQQQLVKAADTVKDAVLPSKEEQDNKVDQDVETRPLAPAGHHDTEKVRKAKERRHPCCM
jgi:hypothetical protein